MGASLPRRVLGAVGGLGCKVWDHVTFAGEVLADFLELGKPQYHEEIKALRRASRRMDREHAAREAEEAARLEDPL
eukprot:NODE_16901_length_972_cov_2.370414.p2 GENE.NODE_16901_length_972_cov_2.370414~~NODE_16901_length_972_cov_2.370414.p2  ORF type:complete len:76 (-),score=28.14 NODE_16901_length_972_cov_2.370414:743-970(-)